MHVTNKVIASTTILTCAFLLSGCEKKQSTVSVPSLPLIFSAVSDLVPTSGGKRYSAIMPHVCSLARNEKNLSDVAKDLSQKNIDLSSIPETGNELSILINKDNFFRITACAAYLSTEPYEFESNTRFMVKDNSIDDKSSGKDINPEKKNAVLDIQVLGPYLRTKMSQAIADAEIFTLIALELKKKEGLTPLEYSEQAKTLFVKLAPYYLERVSMLYFKEQHANYNVLEYTDKVMKFSNSNGFTFTNGVPGFSLYFNQAPWIKNEKLLGNSYFINTQVFDKRWLDAIKTNESGEKTNFMR